jgi:hypothetical protein
MFSLNISAENLQELTNKMAAAWTDITGYSPVAPVKETIADHVKDPRQLELPLKDSSTKPVDTASKLESSIEGEVVSDLDKDGRRWDERIDNPLKVKDRFGRWKSKAGVDKTTRIRIVEELKGNVKSEPTPVPAVEQQEPVVEVAQEINQVEAPTESKEQMTLEHFSNNFAVVMADLYNTKKLNDEKVKELCDIARVQQAWQIPLNEVSVKAVYNNLIESNLI